MAYTQEQLDAIAQVIEVINEKVNIILVARGNADTLIGELHESFSDNGELMAAINVAKLKAKIASEELVVALS